jgi:hypothetical protein
VKGRLQWNEGLQFLEFQFFLLDRLIFFQSFLASRAGRGLQISDPKLSLQLLFKFARFFFLNLSLSISLSLLSPRQTYKVLRENA